MRITVNPKESDVLTIGDFVLVNEMILRLVSNGDYIDLVHMEKPELYQHEPFQHENHVYNHLKKHYGKDGFEIVKSEKVELVIKG